LPPNPGFRDAKWPKVEEAWEYFFPDTKYIEAHRALDDAQHEALIALNAVAPSVYLLKIP
jgi:DNA polymerase-3 subunit epsilon